MPGVSKIHGTHKANQAGCIWQANPQAGYDGTFAKYPHKAIMLPLLKKKISFEQTLKNTRQIIFK